ncbi:MAG: hypothetical protein ACREC6_07725 [Hyphomicrobiaceae bacterium]
MLTKTNLKERGWTEGLIRKCLGDPHKTSPNPHYSSAAPVKLYLEERVKAAEGTPEFAAAKAIAASRSRSSRAVADRNRAALLVEIESVAIVIPTLTERELCRRAIASWEDWNAGYDRFDGDGRDADLKTVRRWMVNYLRHECTEYDVHIAGLFKRIGKQQAYKKLKARILDAIADKFVYLADECRRQKMELEVQKE